MTIINTNVNALSTQASLASNSRALATAMQQLSTGKRINSAKDDAAGMAISTRITQQVQALDQSVRNAGDAISLIQTAEGATNEITSMLQRMRELSIQAINDTNANEQRGYLDQEFQQLKQQIVQIADSTEWNGFPILNGSAGQQVGQVPMVRTTGNGQYVSGIAFSAGTVTGTNSGQLSTTGSPTKSGNLSVSVDVGGATATGTLTLDDGRKLDYAGVVTGNSITFAGLGGFGIDTDKVAGWASPEKASVTIKRDYGKLNALTAGDVTINDKTIPKADSKDDALSPAGNAVGSAIARVAAINSQSKVSGVTAVIGETVMTGTAMSVAVLTPPNVPPSGSVTINGFNTDVFSTLQNNTQLSRAVTVQAINKISNKTGVVASDTGGDAGGITLRAADGRNIEVAFNTFSADATFSSATGLKQGAQSGTYSLSAKVGTDLLIGTNTGAIGNSGLQAGHFDDNSSEVSTITRPSVNPVSGQKTAALRPGDLVLNGVPIPGSQDQKDPLTGDALAYMDATSSVAIAAAINSQSALTGITAKPSPMVISGSQITTVHTPAGAYVLGGDDGATKVVKLYINGTAVDVPFYADADKRAGAIVDAVKIKVASVTASYAGGGSGITLTAKDGQNLSVWFDPAVAGSIDAKDFGLSVVDVKSAASASDAVTHFGGVNLYSTMPPAPLPLPPSIAGHPTPPPAPTGKIEVGTGVNGASAASNFSALGFVAGTYGGPSGLEMSAPRVGRLTFQIGATAGQVINIDLADFGSNGPITGSITGDVGQAKPSVGIATAASATAVLASLDASMNQINASRASMGAVMNRLTHVINNLTNVVTNSKQSRSQIEDADYATASTDLARAQIIQQAATAVLAQANQSAQGVLKLLQG